MQQFSNMGSKYEAALPLQYYVIPSLSLSLSPPLSLFSLSLSLYLSLYIYIYILIHACQSTELGTG